MKKDRIDKITQVEYKLPLTTASQFRAFPNALTQTAMGEAADEFSRQVRQQAIKDCIAAVEEQPIIRSSNGAWTIESVQKPIVIAALTKLLEEKHAK